MLSIVDATGIQQFSYYLADFLRYLVFLVSNMKNILLWICIILSVKSANAQCDSVEYVMEGTLKNNSSTDLMIQLTPGTDIPAIGATGELNKYFETTLFGFISTGWLTIGVIKILEVQAGVAYAKVMEKHSEMTMNGEKKNNFEAGKTVQFTWKDAPRIEPYYQIKNGDTLAIGEQYCNEKTGKWTFYYPSGKIQEIDYYQNGYLEGEYKVWNESGAVIEVGNYSQGKRNGALVMYYDNGKTKKSEFYKEDKLDGLSEKWYPNGNKEFEINYTDGVLNGVFKDYFVDGKVKVEGAYLNGEYEGDLKVYYENGALKYQTNFTKGKKNGKYFGYYESGKPHIETEFSAGEINGTYTEYYESGELHFQCSFVNGKKTGLWKEYYDNGQMAVTGVYNSDGQKSGIWIEYFENGQIEITGAYNEQGKKTGMWEEFYENGLPASKGTYENDVKIGKWMNWDADGKKTKTSY
jgi:antitoxin component YwqK of YwqJK toxin-antitoxin module